MSHIRIPGCRLTLEIRPGAMIKIITGMGSATIAHEMVGYHV
jgi:hypothetical protein